VGGFCAMVFFGTRRIPFFRVCCCAVLVLAALPEFAGCYFHVTCLVLAPAGFLFGRAGGRLVPVCVLAVAIWCPVGTPSGWQGFLR